MRPFGEGQIVGSNDRCLLRPLRDHLEQELRAHLGERDVSNFIQRNQIVTGPAHQHASELQLMLGLDQFVDQCRGGRESHPPLLPAGSDHESGEQMGFAGASVFIRGRRASRGARPTLCARSLVRAAIGSQ